MNTSFIFIFYVFVDIAGRPEKLPDVCYSWWVLASLKIIGRIHWIDKNKLEKFILACQDDETGGFADRPGDMVSKTELQKKHVTDFSVLATSVRTKEKKIVVPQTNRLKFLVVHPSFWLSILGTR